MSAESKALPQIIAVGGHSMTTNEEDIALSRYMLAQVPAQRPRVCLLPQAGGEDSLYIANFYRHFLELNALPSDLSLFKPHTADIASFLLGHDIIYVGGGNTKSMLALWREWQVDQILRQAWEQGILLSGVSAGAICWFEQGLTDSIPGELTALGCLGILPGSCSPHFDGETERRPSYHRLIADRDVASGYGIDDYAALHFVGAEQPRIVASRPGATAYQVMPTPAGASETSLHASHLLSLEEAGGQVTI